MKISPCIILAAVLALISLFSTSAQAQPAQLLKLDQRIPVVINGDTLDFPWTGGFNSVIPAAIDLDGDNLMDLILLDRIGNRLTCFLNNGVSGTVSYRYAPEFTSRLPRLHDWVIAADADCDGDKDLFTYGNSAIAYWRNDFSTASGLQFTLAVPQLSSWYGTFFNPVFVSQVNVPAIVDVDGDSDLDIITFANSSNYLEFHRNYAMDSLGICNAFRFYLDPECWGRFKLSALTNIGLLNQNCRSAFDQTGVPESGSRHAGSVLTPLDQDCDGDIDLLNGDILGENMLFLLNGGTPDSAFIVSQDSAFPVYDVPVNMQNLPGAYYLDLDSDGKKDLLVSPYATVGEDFSNLHFYKNTTDNCTNVFDFVTPRLFSSETIDIGTGANATFFDVDNDGLKDIVAGNDLYFNTNPNLAYSRLAYFRNTGSATQPAFSLVSDDWLGLSSITQYGLFPSFGDLDGDGDSDMLLGNADGSLLYFQNTAGAGNPCVFVLAAPQYQGIDIGNNSTPQIVDVNRDGKNDLLIGERSGVMNYYENTGTSSSPVFSLVSPNFGGVNVMIPGTIAGYSIPQLIDRGNGYELLVGSDRGTIFRYTDIDGNLSGSFTLADSVFENIEELKRITISVADIDGDSKPDLLTGCNAGGFRLYTQNASLGINHEIATLPELSVFPNPASDRIMVRLNGNFRFETGLLSLLDVSGKLIRQFGLQHSQAELDVSDLDKGIYLLVCKSGARTMYQKLVIQ